MTVIFNQLILELKGINDKDYEWNENKIVCSCVYKSKRKEKDIIDLNKDSLILHNRADEKMHWNKI